MNFNKERKNIKSVNIRSIALKRKLLIAPHKIKVLQSYLRDKIEEEVIIVNTNLGIEIYYYSNNDYYNFIKESSLLYLDKDADISKLKYRFYDTKSDVYESFCESLNTFVKYPQIFLAYAKKFTKLNIEYQDSRYIMPVLNSFFEEILATIEKTGKIPHENKLVNRKKSQRSILGNHIIRKLIVEILSSEHKN